MEETVYGRDSVWSRQCMEETVYRGDSVWRTHYNEECMKETIGFNTTQLYSHIKLESS